MKLRTLIAFWLLVVTFGAAIAAEKKVDYSEKYKIDTFKFGDMIDITFLPTTQEYKWNTKYPAKLIFPCVVMWSVLQSRKRLR